MISGYDFLRNKILALLISFLMAFMCFNTAYAENKTSDPNPSSEDLSKPSLSSSEIISWAEKTVTQTFTYDFLNYQKVLQDASKYYTPETWNSFNNALKKSGNLEAIKEHKIKVTADVDGAGEIVKEGDVNGRYSWTVEVPTKISYATSDPHTANKKPDEILTTVEIIRIPPKDTNPQGLAINSLIQRHK